MEHVPFNFERQSVKTEQGPRLCGNIRNQLEINWKFVNKQLIFRHNINVIALIFHSHAWRQHLVLPYWGSGFWKAIEVGVFFCISVCYSSRQVGVALDTCSASLYSSCCRCGLKGQRLRASKSLLPTVSYFCENLSWLKKFCAGDGKTTTELTLYADDTVFVFVMWTGGGGE